MLRSVRLLSISHKRLLLMHWSDRFRLDNRSTTRRSCWFWLRDLLYSLRLGRIIMKVWRLNLLLLRSTRFLYRNLFWRFRLIRRNLRSLLYRLRFLFDRSDFLLRGWGFKIFVCVPIFVKNLLLMKNCVRELTIHHTFWKKRLDSVLNNLSCKNLIDAWTFSFIGREHIGNQSSNLFWKSWAEWVVASFRNSHSEHLKWSAIKRRFQSAKFIK